MSRESAPLPVAVSAHAVLRFAERGLGIDLTALWQAVATGPLSAHGEGGQMAVLHQFMAALPAEVTAWQEYLRRKVERYTVWGVPSFIVVDFHHNVKIVVRHLTVVTVLRRKPAIKQIKRQRLTAPVVRADEGVTDVAA